MSATVALYRTLQFANSGASGVVITSDSDNGNPGNSTGNGQDDSSGSPDLIGVAIFMAAGVGVIFAVVWATWFLSYISDRLCCCCPWFQPVTSIQDLEANFDRGAVARKARLWGLTIEDRLKILNDFFQKMAFAFDEAMLKSASKKADSGLNSESKDQEEPSNTDSEKSTESKIDDVDKANLNEDVEEGVSRDEADAGSEEESGDRSGAIGDMKEESLEGTKLESASFEKEPMDSSKDPKDEDQGEADQEDKTEGEVQEKEVLDDADHERICCICLNEYEQGDKLMTGTQCIHKLHFDCCMEWMRKHDHCPYCRQEMLTAMEMREQAKETLGDEKVKALGSGAAPPVTEPTTVSIPEAQQSSNDEENPTLPNENAPLEIERNEEEPQTSSTADVPDGSEEHRGEADNEGKNEEFDLEKGNVSLDTNKSESENEEGGKA